MIKAALGSSPIITNTSTKVQEALFANRPTVYVCVVLVAVLASYAYWLRTQSIFSCQADGYNADRYLAYCHGANYAEYEHGAVYFDLEPAVQNFARNADVLFLGNSRLQVAFSTAATADWFSAASARYYLLGFSYFENMTFAEKLLRKIHPRAKVYVINVDDFFERSETEPMKTISHDPEAVRNQYETKRLWQQPHERICKTFAALCGTKFVIFRSRETGAYYTEGAFQHTTVPVSYDQVINKDVVIRNTAAAADFLSQFTKGSCVILTNVPFVGTKIGNANAIGAGLGMKLVIPEVSEGLQTFDGYHLDKPSAEHWSQAFFQAAGSKIQSCLGEQRTAHP
jgi:hypothetical protein